VSLAAISFSSARGQEKESQPRGESPDPPENVTEPAQVPPQPNALLRTLKKVEEYGDPVMMFFNTYLGTVIFFEIGRSEQDFRIELKNVSSRPEERVDQLIDALGELKAEARSKGVSIPGVITELSVVLPIAGKTAARKEKDDFAALSKTLRRRAAVELERAKALHGVKVAVTGANGASPSLTLKTIRKGIPFIVLWLIAGASFLTIRMGFISIRGFRHAVVVTAGKYDNAREHGEVNHFQALTTALSATVGLGNIAGVTTAIIAGGPGAVVWMIVAGFLGMTSKMAECTLGQMYRRDRSDGQVMGGAMYYLSDGLKSIGLGPLGAVLAVMFAAMCVGGSFAGGNAYQVNQSLSAIQESIPFFKEHPASYGLLMAVLTGVVILGGIKRIANVADKIVPTMCGLYIACCLLVVVTNLGTIPAVIGLVLQSAMTPEAGYGGVLGVLTMGFQRAAFSNEAGVGSAAIAHSAAKSEYPVREGIVALLEPFIDTIVVCSMTAALIITSGAHDSTNEAYTGLIQEAKFAAVTGKAIGSRVPGGEWFLCVAVFLFAFSTQISWSYYGERCWAYLFGDGRSLVYKVIFLGFTFFGAIVSSTAALDFGDLMILGMAFPNLLGVVLLSGQVRRSLDDYWAKYKAGEFDVAKNGQA
jgi:AGCS family alanine or glycine:cation symporter